jgi:hypothetical protein
MVAWIVHKWFKDLVEECETTKESPTASGCGFKKWTVASFFDFTVIVHVLRLSWSAPDFNVAVCGFITRMGTGAEESCDDNNGEYNPAAFDEAPLTPRPL